MSVAQERELGVEEMKGEWDQRARENARYFIAAEEQNWDEGSFLESGKRDVARHLSPFLQSLNIDFQQHRVLEIGCGIGRMSFALAKLFAEVFATDISPEMIARAQRKKESLGIQNISFDCGNGRDLSQFRSNFFDVCFSYIVFQHIPDEAIIKNYVMEMGRVLRVGGICRFQVNGYRFHRLFGNRYFFWGKRETGRLRRLGIYSRPFIEFGRLNTWSGVPVTQKAIEQTMIDAGLRCLEVTGAGTQYMWISGVKGQICG